MYIGRGILFCPPSRVRTYDLTVKSRLLYQLSYGRILFYITKNKSVPSVLGARLELARLTTTDLKSVAATNYATRAFS